jgi:hypothetical protein
VAAFVLEKHLGFAIGSVVERSDQWATANAELTAVDIRVCQKIVAARAPDYFGAAVSRNGLGALIPVRMFRQVSTKYTPSAKLSSKRR